MANIYRIQHKIISRQKIDVKISRILDMRSRGFSQQEVADRLEVDRTFVSRLEGIGEIRKGETIAVVGFPIGNKEEIQSILEKEGVDFALLFTEKERIAFVENGPEPSVKRAHEYYRQIQELDVVTVWF